MANMDRPTDKAVPSPVLRQCVLAATAAPSVHNTQPWLFRLRPDAIDVLVDRNRQLHSLDPQGREMYVSVGAAVFNLRLALRASGWRTEARLTPDVNADLAARVKISGSVRITPAALALAEAIQRRHTNRRPFTDKPVADEIITELARAAATEGADLMVTDGPLRDGVLSLTRTADNRMRRDKTYRAELAAWTTAGGVGRRDGVPRQSFGPRDKDAALPMRDLGLGIGAATAVVEFESEPTILLLFTVGDTPADWLRAGAALQRVWLTGTVRGLAATPLTQVTEIPQLRELLAESATGRVVQTVLRIGYPSVPAAATPRRSLDEVVIADAN